MKISQVLILLLLSCNFHQGADKIFYPSGDSEIDGVRKEITVHPTDVTNFRRRTVLLYDWVGALQQQGASLISFYTTDLNYYRLESKLLQSVGQDLLKTQKEMFALIDNGFKELEEIQTSLIENGAFVRSFEGVAEGFSGSGKKDSDWPMFQANENNTGSTDARGPVFGREKWKVPVGLGWYSRPVIEGNRVYIASPGLRNTCFCLDLNTGDEIWKSTQEHPKFGIYKFPAIQSTPLIINDKIILRETNSHGGNIGQAKNLVYIDKKTGKSIAYKYAGHIDYRTQYAPVVSDGKYMVYPFGIHDIYGSPAICQNFNRLICTDIDNDHILWDFNVGDIDVLAEPLISNDLVFQGTSEGYLYALFLKGRNNDERVAWSFRADGPVNTQVAIDSGKLFFGANGGTVYCLDELTGRIIWETTVKDVERGARKHFSVPVIFGNRLYIGAANKRLYCFNLNDGKVIWENSVDDWIRSRPIVTPGGIMVASISGKLYCFDEDGKFNWEKTISTHPVYSDIVFSGDKILITDSNLYLYAVDLNGEIIWSKSILSAFTTGQGERVFTDQLSGGTYYQSKPTAVKGKLYFGTPSGFLYAIDSETGEEIWKFEMGAAISVGPAVQDGKVYAGQQGGERFFYCLDAGNGELVWKQTIPGGWVWGSAVVSDGMVYVPTVSGYAVCLDGKTGHIIWLYPTEKSIPAEPAVYQNLVYFGSWSRTLYAFDKKTGEIKWKVNGIGLDSGTLMVNNDTIYVPHHSNIFMSFNALTGRVISHGNTNESEKGIYSNFNATPAFGEGSAYFTARVGTGLHGVPLASRIYCVDPISAKIRWTHPDGGGLSAPALANGRLYVASGNSPFFYCLDQKTGKPYWIHKLGNRVEEATLCIYRDKVYVLAADGYLHAIE